MFIIINVRLFNSQMIQKSFFFYNYFHRCKIPECDNNVTEYSPIWLKNAVPYRHNEPEKCYRYATKMHGNSSIHQCSLDEFDNTNRMKCDEFVYKTNEVTILNEVSRNNIITLCSINM